MSNNGNNSKIHTDETLKLLGKKITSQVYRDAIHLAVVPCVAGHDIKVGQQVGIYTDLSKSKEGYYIAGLHTQQKVGIVDPFLKENISKGEVFWLYLFPGSVTSLRHHWEHPAFED